MNPKETPNRALNELSLSKRVDWSALGETLLSLANSEPKYLNAPFATIRFTKEFDKGEPSISNLYVLARLENGREMVRYRLLPNLTGDALSKCRDILDAGLSGSLNPEKVLKQLEKEIPKGTTYSWIPERIKPYQSKEVETALTDTEVAPMQLVVPSFAEFVKNPQSLGSRFFSAHKIGPCQYRLETLIDTSNGLVIAELFSTDDNPGTQPRWDLHVKSMATPKESRTEASLRKDLLLLSYAIHEVFWDKGPASLREFLCQNDSPGAESVEAVSEEYVEPSVTAENPLAALDNVSLQREVCEIVHTFPSEAVLKFATRGNEAVMQLQSAPSEDAAACYWIFQDEQDLSVDGNPKRQAILRAIDQLTNSESDSIRLTVLHDLKRLKSSFLSEPATMEYLVGAELARCLPEMREISVSPTAPSTDQEILDVCSGISHLQVRFLDREIKKQSPQLFDVMYLGIRGSGDTYVTILNHLQGRGDAFISSNIFPMFGGSTEMIRELCQGFNDQIHKGRVSVQNRLQSFCDVDPDDSSWALWTGEPALACLPPAYDLWGQQMYDLGAKIVKKYAKVSFTTPDESRVSWIQDGVVETTLGGDDDPFFIKFILERDAVRGIEIYDQNKQEQALYTCQVPIGTSVSAMRTVDTTIKLFDELLTSRVMGGSDPLTTSALFQFLEKKFGDRSKSDKT